MASEDCELFPEARVIRVLVFADVVSFIPLVEKFGGNGHGADEQRIAVAHGAPPPKTTEEKSEADFDA
jgi:hypothetical protein